MSSLNSIPVTTEVATGNVEPLLHEIRHALGRLAEGGEGTAIDLTRLPLAPGEEERIYEFLGEGEVKVDLDALGPTRIVESTYPGVWLITHYNHNQAVVGRFIEVTRFPELLKSQRSDIEYGVDRLERELNI